MTTEFKKSFKELEEERKELLPDDSKETVIETVNTVHQILEVIGLGITIPSISLVKTMLFFLGHQEEN